MALTCQSSPPSRSGSGVATVFLEGKPFATCSPMHFTVLVALETCRGALHGANRLLIYPSPHLRNEFRTIQLQHVEVEGKDDCVSDDVTYSTAKNFRRVCPISPTTVLPHSLACLQVEGVPKIEKIWNVSTGFMRIPSVIALRTEKVSERLHAMECLAHRYGMSPCDMYI